MKSYADYGIALETFVRNNPRPKVTRTFYAYKFGEVHAFKSQAEALKFSSLVDYVLELQDSVNWNAEVIRLEELQKEAWLADLRAELSELSVQEFDDLYKDTDSGMDSPDEIADAMIDAHRTMAYERLLQKETDLLQHLNQVISDITANKAEIVAARPVR